MRVVLAPEGTRGDVHPLLSLGARFREAGHSVAICAATDFDADTREFGLDFFPSGLPVREWLRDRAAVVTGGGLGALRESHRYMKEYLVSQAEALWQACEDADLVIGAGVQLAGSSVAEARGADYRFVAYCPALFPSGEYPPFVVAKQTMPPWLNRLSWRAMLAFYRRLLRGDIDRWRARYGLGPVGDVYRALMSRHPVLAADALLGPAPGDFDEVPLTQIPCMHPVDGPELPAKLQSFLAAGPAPVYLGFGSMTDPDPDATTRELIEAVERAGCRALVSEGWAELGATPLPENVLAIGTVSHARLFRRVAAVVHHGGAGTTTTAARAGAPQIVIPHLLDQFYWGHRVETLGLGLQAPSRARLRADSLGALLREVLQNEMLAERARQVGAELREHARRDPLPVFLGD